MKKKSVWIPIAVFLIWIFGGFLWGLIKPDQVYSDTENRYLASRPDFSWKRLFDGSFAGDYENYITDQFPMRDQWIGVKTGAEKAFGKVETKDVWLAKDGYLIVNYPASDFESERAQANAESLAEALKYYTQTLGADHVRVLLAPTASQILTDKLPGGCLNYDQSLYLERVRKAAEASVGDAKMFVEVSQVLSAHREEEIYYRTDHHWTTLGAYYAYCAWAGSLGITPVSDSGLKIVSDDFLGTTWSRLHWADRKDQIWVYDTDLSVTLRHDLLRETEGFYDWDALKKRDQYAVFLGGNDGLLEVIRNDAADLSAPSVLLVVKDSFANCFVPYASEHYDRVIVADLRYLNMSLKELARQYGVTDLLVLYNAQAFATDASVFKISR